jgi:SOS-response transcriptional repressor LexA
MNQNRHTINKVMSGDIRSDKDKILFGAILKHLGIQDDEFFKRAEANPLPKAESLKQDAPRVPLLGSIPAGNATDVSGITDVEDYLPLPANLEGKRADKYFALTVRGDSMEPYLLDKDIVYLETLDGLHLGPKEKGSPAPQELFDRVNGRIVATLRNGDATLKMLQLKPLGNGEFDLFLVSFNKNYAPKYITENCEVFFQGAVVAVLRDSTGMLKSYMGEISNAN